MDNPVAAAVLVVAAGAGGTEWSQLSGDEVRANAGVSAVPAITAGLEMTNAIFQGEKLSGAQVFYANAPTLKKIRCAECEKKLNLHIQVHSRRITPRMCGHPRRRRPRSEERVVVMSAHLDISG